MKLQQAKAHELTEYRGWMMTVREAGQQLATEMHLSGGVKTEGIVATCGLSRMANVWLSRNTENSGRVVEVDLENGKSIYYPTWK